MPSCRICNIDDIIYLTLLKKFSMLVDANVMKFSELSDVVFSETSNVLDDKIVENYDALGEELTSLDFYSDPEHLMGKSANWFNYMINSAEIDSMLFVDYDHGKKINSHKKRLLSDIISYSKKLQIKFVKDDEEMKQVMLGSLVPEDILVMNNNVVIDAFLELGAISTAYISEWGWTIKYDEMIRDMENVHMIEGYTEYFNNISKIHADSDNESVEDVLKDMCREER